VFILRLYKDLENRDQICGDLQALPGRKTSPFKNKEELLDLVMHLANKGSEGLPLHEAHDENGPNFSGSKHTVE
jgi:hypothetical protein